MKFTRKYFTETSRALDDSSRRAAQARVGDRSGGAFLICVAAAMETEKSWREKLAD